MDKGKKLLTELVTHHSAERPKTFFQGEFSKVYRTVSTKTFQNFNLGYIYTKNEDTQFSFKEVLQFECEGGTLLSQSLNENESSINLEITPSGSNIIFLISESETSLKLTDQF